MAIASSGENLVPIKDNFKGLGRWSDTETATLQGSSCVITSSHLISFKDEKPLSYSYDIPLGSFGLSVLLNNSSVMWFGVFYQLIYHNNPTFLRYYCKHLHICK